MSLTIGRKPESTRSSTHFCDRDKVASVLKGKRIALVGSGPGVLHNPPGLVDSFDLVCRVNNYKTSERAGFRSDIYYSFFGSSIRKEAKDLIRDGVKLCICKCPDAQFMHSRWHRRMGKLNGVDFRYIYKARARWWFCDTYVPTLAEFLKGFNLLGGHVPTTGFAALLDLLSHQPETVYMTGFDFFASGVHNVNERWKPGDPSDPIGHAPERERDWLMKADIPVTLDPELTRIRSAYRT